MGFIKDYKKSPADAAGWNRIQVTLHMLYERAGITAYRFAPFLQERQADYDVVESRLREIILDNLPCDTELITYAAPMQTRQLVYSIRLQILRSSVSLISQACSLGEDKSRAQQDLNVIRAQFHYLSATPPAKGQCWG